MKPGDITLINVPQENDRVTLTSKGEGLNLSFELHGSDGQLLAIGASSRRLADWALAAGAKEVRYAYDLRGDP